MSSRQPQPGVEPDPTGGRELLAGLPDPGSMPVEVTDRIEVAIAALPPLSSAAQPVTGRAPRWQRALLGAAAAAVVVVGGGSVAARMIGVSSGSGTTAGSAAQMDSVPEAVSASTMLTATGRSYHSGDLAAELDGRSDSTKQLHDSTRAAPTPPAPAGSPDVRVMATGVDARGCAAALGIPASVPVTVDLADVDGMPAAIVLAGPPDGPRTAYAVARTCAPGAPGIIVGPLELP